MFGRPYFNRKFDCITLYYCVPNMVYKVKNRKNVIKTGKIELISLSNCSNRISRGEIQGTAETPYLYTAMQNTLGL